MYCQCRFILFLVLLYHRSESFLYEDETNLSNFVSTNLVVDQTSKNKVENLGSVLKKHIHLLRKLPGTQLDLIFLIDSSASVGKKDFQNEVKFVRQLLADFTVDNNNTKISVITFSSRRFVLRQIDYITPQREEKHKCTLIENDLPKIRYKGGGTYTRGAFREAKKVLQSARPDSNKAIFLITDGFSNGGDPRPEARRIRENGVKIFTVGIAKGNKEELWDMSSEPKNETCYILDSFEEFESLARRALHEDLGRGDFIMQQEDKCNGLCFEGYDCCDEKASCKCGTYTGTYECICRPGYYGTGLKGSCKPCPPGTYKTKASPGDVNTCTRCPDENHTTFKGSVDLSQCVCKKGFRDFNNTGCVAMRCEVLSRPKNGYFVNDKCDNVFNAACGIRCKPGYYLKGSSLRICQEGGSWSGRPTECIMKTCPALPRPKNGNMICDKDGFLFSTVCRFTCDTGYKLVGSRKRECLAIADWTGINTKCREITCRPLPFVKDGKIYPSACTKDDVLFGTTCQITCYHGYSVVGPPIKQCTPDGMWMPSADGEMTHCDDTSPPIMKCPRDIETEADADDSTAEVVWQPPVALDNSGIRPIVTVVPAIEPPKKFPIGFTKVKYIAEDLSGNKVKCTFTVFVKDVTPPMSDRCVSPFPYVTSELYANVTWDEPEFSDNSGTVARVERTMAPGLFPQGKTEVVYTAFDESGNNNTCTLTVNVLPHPCQYPPAPVNGERECFETDEGVHCKVYCLEGYAFAIPPADDYFCAYDHIWRPEDKLPIPDCSVQTTTNSVIQPASVTYIGTVPCRKQVLVNEIETVFHQKVTERVESMCGDNIECEVDNVQTTCEESNDFNKIKLVFNHRNKRSTKTKDVFRRRRAQTRRKRRRGRRTYKITFDFTVKGEMKKEKKPRKAKTKLPKENTLERSMERILGAVEEEATKGSWDLKMDGKMMMQFSNMSYDAEDHKFECEPGSILVNTSCIKCPVGTLFNVIHEECQSCPQGSYQPVEGQVTCLVCPDYTSTPHNNSRSRQDCKSLCLPGTFSEDGLEQCTTCPERFYQNKYGQESCIECPKGTTTYKRGVRRPSMCRVECRPGYVSKTGLEPCLPCPKGTYQSDIGKTVCLECPVGGKTTDIGSTDITDCEGSWDYQSDAPEETEFSECFSNLCKNGATCQSRGFLIGFDCLCVAGYTGVYCETELNQCESKPCLNEGTCINLKTGYSCACTDGYTGTKCEVNIDECYDNPCVNNGTCIDGVNSYNCSCPPAFEGDKCERLKDDCKTSPCQHEGTCVNTLQGYDCQCVNGYSGVDCEINEDDCSSGPCSNGAKCIDGIAEYKCQCLPGYTGKQCEIDINECSTSPCHTGATCVDEINQFKCLCPSTFSGKLCETELDGSYMLDFPTSGTVDYASITMKKDLTAFTIAFWIKTSDEINQGTPFSYSVGDYDNALTITNYDGFVIYVNNKKMNTDINANDGTWHHVLITWSSNRGAWKIYKNAFLWDQGYDLAAGETIKGGGTVVIGQEQDVGGAFSQPESFVGLLTHLNLWSQELTFSQIEKMIVTCDKIIGDVIAWPDVQSGLHGDLQPNPSGFCQGTGYGYYGYG